MIGKPYSVVEINYSGKKSKEKDFPKYFAFKESKSFDPTSRLFSSKSPVVLQKFTVGQILSVFESGS